MHNFLKPKPAHEKNSEAFVLIEALARENGRIYPFALKNFPAGQKIQQAEPEIQRQVTLSLVEWLEGDRPKPGQRDGWSRHWKMQNSMLLLLAGDLPFTEGDVRYFLDWSVRQAASFGTKVF